MLTLDDVHRASRRIRGTCIRTPVLPWPDNGATKAAPLTLKAESLQRTGAFKLRGAVNAVALLTAEQKRRGVITHSSGNHGQALAAAASHKGIRCIVVMPADASELKISACREWAGEVVLVPPDQREAACLDIARSTGSHVILPFNDESVIAGQGTIGLELLQQVPDMDTVLVPVGGGGLISGIGLAIKESNPRVRIVAVEPELAGDLHESLVKGTRVRWDAATTAATLADGLRSTCVGELNWELIQTYVDDAITVTESAIVDSMRTILQRARIIVEPSGAVATAAYLSCPNPNRFGKTVAVVSGGNVAISTLRRVLDA
jgi:threonine dehydratase